MEGSSFLVCLPGKSRRPMRLSLGFAGLVILLSVSWACNSPAIVQVVRVEVTATPKPDSQAVAQIETDGDNKASPAQLEGKTPTDTATSQKEDSDDNQSDTPIAQSLLLDARHIEGDPNAPVTIVEFSDFKCPFCARFATHTLPSLREYYVKTGKVRFAYKHIATLGPESIRAAEASECAAEQNQFWAYHDRVFADQAAKSSVLNDEMLLKLAADTGLETEAFSECFASGRYIDQIKTQTVEAQRLGLRATPGFVVNNSFMMGAQPYVAFARMINEELDNLGWEAPAGQALTSVVDEIKGLIVYPPSPPSADILNGVVQNCGIYDEAVSVDNVLSSLARGAVWIAYRSNLPAEQVEILREVAGRALAQRDEPMVILSPGPYTDRDIVVSAWQVQLILEDAADPRLEQFLEKFQVGPFTPEPGEPCSGGIGQPSD